MSRDKLIDLVDSEIRPNYYITFFITNTCELFQEEDTKLTNEILFKLGKYLREIKAKPKRERIFKEISDKIRNIAISFVPL